MFVCKACHRGCPVTHSVISFGPCEVCRKETETYDCVTSKPVTKDELHADKHTVPPGAKMAIQMYRSTRRVEYPKKKGT